MANRPITVGFQKEDAANLKVIMSDSKVAKGPSEALRLCIEDAYRVKPNFKRDLEIARHFDDSNIVIDAENDLKTKSFLVDEDIFKSVYEDVKNQMGLLKPRISYVVKICLASARVRFEKENKQGFFAEDVNPEKTVEEPLPSKGNLMMEVGRLYELGTDESIEKLKKIVEIVRGN